MLDKDIGSGLSEWWSWLVDEMDLLTRALLHINIAHDWSLWIQHLGIGKVV